MAMALLCAAFGSEALTLGRMRGAALVGQPLNLVIEAQVDPGEDAAALCFEADVFYADTRQDASRVRVQVEATAPDQSARVRVLSSALVDEPVVTLYLRAGCGQKTTRRYVLLADMPSEVGASLTPLALTAPAAAVPAPAPLSPAAAALAGATVSATPTTEPTARPRVVRQRPNGKAGLGAAKRASPQALGKSARASGQARLKLDPLDFLSDRIANLAPPPTAPTPEDLLQQQRMQTLEGSVKSLLAAAAKSEASLLDLKGRLHKAESERFSGAVVYGLLALVLVCLAALAWLWSRQRRLSTPGADWWSASVMPPAAPGPEPDSPPAPTAERGAPADSGLSTPPDTAVASAFPPDDEHSAAAVDVDLVDMSDSFFDNLVQLAPAPASERQDPLLPSTRMARRLGLAADLNSEAMLDIRQQAEFFVSLGQPEQGLRILKRQIHESEEPNPFVYLDLFGIVHALGLKTEFQQWRENFHRLFTGRVPEFVFFKQEGRDLESYPEVLANLTTLWSSAKVLELLDACIFRDAQEAHGRSFELAAFRDLLLLQAVAYSVVHAPDALASETKGGTAADPGAPGAALATSGPASVLDLDLSESNSAEPADGALPELHLDLPRLMPDEPGEGAPGGAALPVAHGNLIDFDVTAAPSLPEPGARKPG